MKSVGLGAIMGIFLLGLAHGQRNQLVIDTDEYHYAASFDAARISEEHLRELLVFSPYEFGVYGWKIDDQKIQAVLGIHPHEIVKFAVATPIEQCVDGDPDYRSCGSRDVSDPNFFANAEINIKKNEQALAALNQLNVPPELAIVSQYFRDSLAFDSTIQQRRLQYLRTGDLHVLSTKIGTVDPSKECAVEMKELQLASTLHRRYELSYAPWPNCVTSAWHRSSAKYPQNAWPEFLHDYGITEQFTPKPTDD